MSCYLSLIGESFDIDDFTSKVNLQFDGKSYKGEPQFRASNPEGPKIRFSSLSVCVSNADFDNFQQQLEDVKAYLIENLEELKLIKQTETIQYAIFGFGVDYDLKAFSKDYYIPADIVALAAEAGIGFEVSVYNPARIDYSD